MARAQRDGSRRGTGRVARLAVLAVVVSLLTSGCSVEEALRFGWPEGITEQATQMRQLWTGAAIAALVVGVITWGAMLWAVAFHRKKKDDDGSLPRQTQYNLPVEIVFTVIPTIIVAVLFAFTVTVQNFVDADPAEPAEVNIDITAFQWNWEFGYPDAPGPDGRPISTLGSSDTIPILVLPTERSIQFTQRSNDVIHSFFVPEFLFKRDVFPLPEVNDQDNVWRISGIEREGAFVGRCAELCGTYHAQMNFEVRALPGDLYDRWIDLRGQVNPATNAVYTAGEALEELGCGELCAPQSTTTYPFETERTQRSASQPITTGS